MVWLRAVLNTAVASPMGLIGTSPSSIWMVCSSSQTV